MNLYNLHARLAALAARVPTSAGPIPFLTIDLVDWDDSAGRLVHTATVTWDRCGRTFREVPAPPEAAP